MTYVCCFRGILNFWGSSWLSVGKAKQFTPLRCCGLMDWDAEPQGDKKSNQQIQLINSLAISSLCRQWRQASEMHTVPGKMAHEGIGGLTHKSPPMSQKLSACTVCHCRYSQRSLFSVAFGYVNPFGWGRLCKSRFRLLSAYRGGL